MKKVIVILFFLSGSFSFFAQIVSVKAELDTNFIRIGEQTDIHLSIDYKVNEGPVNIIFPQLKDTINSTVEIIKKTPIDTIIPDKNETTLFQQYQKITITSFDSGYYVIPPFQFVANTDTLETDAILLEVQNVAVDTSQAIFDIKVPLSEPFSLTDWIKENWLFIGGVFILIVIAFLLVKYFRNRKTAPIEEEPLPEKPIHEIALEKLEKIKEQKLWQAGKTKTYHTEISEILRFYIEHRYGVNALEETTEEILHGLRLHNISTEIMNKLSQTLVLADLVKFAKETPLPNENDLSIINSIDFIESTKLITPLNSDNV